MKSTADSSSRPRARTASTCSRERLAIEGRRRLRDRPANERVRVNDEGGQLRRCVDPGRRPQPRARFELAFPLKHAGDPLAAIDLQLDLAARIDGYAFQVVAHAPALLPQLENVGQGPPPRLPILDGQADIAAAARTCGRE